MSDLIERLSKAAGKPIASIEHDEASITVRAADGEELSLRMGDHNGMQSVIDAAERHWRSKD